MRREQRSLEETETGPEVPLSEKKALRSDSTPSPPRGSYNRGKTFPIDPPTREEVASLFAACQGPTATRDRCLLMLLYRLGLRVGAACALEMQDVRRKKSGVSIRVRRPKGWNPKRSSNGKRKRAARSRELGLDPKALVLLDAWLAERGERPGPLLLTRTGQPIQTSHARRLLPVLARRAGITRRIHPHALRHAIATELLEEGETLARIGAMLGHRSVRTTLVYLEGLGVDAEDVTRGRAW